MINIRNIIFDLGGVILNIDYNKTAEAFKSLGLKNYDELYTQFKQISVFDDLECGFISHEEFYDEVRKLSKLDVSNEQIRDAWNAMLLDFPKKRLELLKKLRDKYRLFLCSNTNEIHLEFYNNVLYKSFGIKSLGDILEKEYYSHKVGMRKPNADIFNLILKENNLKTEETLFIDDSPQHIETAKALGLKTIYLEKGMDIVDIFNG